jgi:hypothetical protein
MNLLSPTDPAATPAAPTTPAAGEPPATPAAAAPANTTPTFSRELPENWFLAAGDAFAAEADTLSRFKTVDDLAKSYVHLRKTGPTYPGQTATPEDVERFRQLAQVPASPEQYGIQKPDNLPDGLQWDDNTLGEFAKIAHANHVPAPAFKALVDSFTQVEAQKLQAAQAAQQQELMQAQELIRRELGPSPADFEKAAARINHTVAVLADKANIDPDDPSLAAIRANPAMIRILNQVAKMTAEDPTRAPAGYGDLRGPREKADDIMKGRDPEWSQKYKEGDRAAIDRVAKLLEQAKK